MRSGGADEAAHNAGGRLQLWLTQVAPAWVWRVLFLFLMVCSTRQVFIYFWHGPTAKSLYGFIYQAATDSFNYIQFGFVRRGLSGTLIYLSGLPQLYGMLVFYFVSVALVAGALCMILHQRIEPMQRLIGAAGVAVILINCWSEDTGRTDPMSAAFIAFAAMALVKRRAVAAALLLIVGLTVHETTFIYGLPLMTGLLIALGKEGRPSRRQLLPALLLLAVVTIGYAFFDRFPRASNAEMTAVIQSRLPPHLFVDLAIYFATSGMRGVVASMCQNSMDPNYGLRLFSGVLIMAMTTAILFGRHWRAWGYAALVGFVPFLFLFIVANDMYRWTLLASFNILLMRLLAPWPAPERTLTNRVTPLPASKLVTVVVSLAFLVLLQDPRGPLRARLAIYTPSPFIEALSIALGGPVTPFVGSVLRKCDPDWRSVLTRP